MVHTPSKLGERVERLRVLSGKSARALSMLAGLSHGALGQLIRGEHPGISGASAAKLASVLGVSLEYLISGEGREPSERMVRAAVEEAEERAAAKAGDAEAA